MKISKVKSKTTYTFEFSEEEVHLLQVFAAAAEQIDSDKPCREAARRFLNKTESSHYNPSVCFTDG